MKCLLDTHAILWTLLEPTKLSRVARRTIENANDEIYVSSVSLWEIAFKSSIGKLEFEEVDIGTIPGYIEKMGIGILELGAQEAIESGRLPFHERHKDPFSRVLVWQAIARRMHFISKDDRMNEYLSDGLKLIW